MKLVLRIFLILTIVTVYFVQTTPKSACAAEGAACCNPDVQQISATQVSFWQYDGTTCVKKVITKPATGDLTFANAGTSQARYTCSGTETCQIQGQIALNTPFGAIPYPNALCTGSANPGSVFQCCSGGNRWDASSGCTNGSTYSCQANQNCTPTLNQGQECINGNNGTSYPNQCCDYSDPRVTYDPSTQRCIKTTVVSGSNGVPTTTSTATSCQTGQVCVQAGYLPNGDPRAFYTCSQQYTDTVECATASDPNARCVNTAFGRINATPGAFISQLIRIGIGIGSGIALLLIIYGSFKIATSQGTPEAISEGREIITSAVIGLVFMVLSVSLMQILGVDILGLGSYGLGR